MEVRAAQDSRRGALVRTRFAAATLTCRPYPGGVSEQPAQSPHDAARAAPGQPPPGHPQRDRRPGDALVAAGAVAFALGLAGAVLTVARFLGASWVPAPLTWLLLLAPAGLGMALVGALRLAREALRGGPGQR